MVSSLELKTLGQVDKFLYKINRSLQGIAARDALGTNKRIGTQNIVGTIVDDVDFVS